MTAAHEPPGSVFRLRTCVWEITLACNARCRHCGSSAGRARDKELDRGEALGVVRELARLGCASVTLSGGEPLERSDWPELARAVIDEGMRVELVTNGLSLGDQAEAVASAGFEAVTISVDGLAAVHDSLRGVAGALDRLLTGARGLRERGVRLAANTQINRESLPWLETIHELLVEEGFRGWKLQLTMAHGRARRERALCLAPGELEPLASRICALRVQSPLRIEVGDNLGYLGRSEPRLRTASGPPTQFWGGCQAGLSVIGVRSDGTVLGCLSLPDALAAGSIRERSLAAIWADDRAFAYNRAFTPSLLEGCCAGCAFGGLCRAGCRSLAWSMTGRPHENPCCLHLVERGSGA